MEEYCTKISSFYPEIITNNLDATHELFEKLGFHKEHEGNNISETKNTVYVCKDEQGHLFQALQADVQRPFVAIRMNVDSFDEALAFFKSQGFTDCRPSGANTAYSKATMLLSPDGYMVHITEHIKGSSD